jgi:hypothetical protein
VNDPDFQILSPAEKRAALFKLTGDKDFSVLRDGDTMQFVSRFQAKVFVVVAPNGQVGSIPAERFSEASAIGYKKADIFDLLTIDRPGQNYDVKAAREAGYSDDEILKYLGSARKFDVQSAIKAGYSKSQIIDRLSSEDRGLKDYSKSGEMGISGQNGAVPHRNPSSQTTWRENMLAWIHAFVFHLLIGALFGLPGGLVVWGFYRMVRFALLG